jgi:hypothetical protein
VKITKEKLKQIIKEELEAVYEQKNDRCPPGKTLQPENGKLVCLEEPMRLAEDGHEDSSSARRAMKTIIEDAGQMLQALEQMDGHLPTWWTNKMAVAAKRCHRKTPPNKAATHFKRCGLFFCIKSMATAKIKIFVNTKNQGDMLIVQAINGFASSTPLPNAYKVSSKSATFPK